MSLLQRIRPFHRDRRGATAVVFAAAAVPLFSLIALAIDYSGIVAARAKLNLAADSGVLMATQDTAYQFNNPPAATGSAENPINAGRSRFSLQAAGVANTVVDHMDLQVKQNGSVFTGTVTYQATYTPMFAGLLGFDSIPVSGTASAVAVTRVYVDFQLIIDGSDSMTIAADGDQASYMETVLENAWGTFGSYAENYPTVQQVGCYFSCHFAITYDDGNPKDQVDFYTASRDAGVVMRFTQVKAAAAALATLIQNKNSQQFRLGVYLAAKDMCVSYIGGTCQFANVVEEQPLTNSVPDVQQTLATLDVTPRPYYLGAYNGDTDLNGSLADFTASYLGTPGDGSTPSGPKKFVILFTDGANDVPGNDGPYANNGHSYPLLDQTKCDALKGAGVTLVVVQTLPPTFSWQGNPVVNDHHGPDYQTLTNNLQACASQNMFFMVDKQADFTNAMTNALNVSLTEPTHFTQ